MQHFANFALGDTELGNLNRQAYEKAKKTGDPTQYKQMQDQQRQAFDSNRLNTATQNAQAGVQAKRAAAAEAKRVAGLGVGGKVKHYGGKALGAAAPWVGGLTTAAMVLPALGSLLPQRQPQPEQEPPY
jgi:anti-sigma factor RsiW